MSGSFRSGMVVLGVLSAIDLVGPLLTDGTHPPMSVALIGAAVGLVSLALVVYGWRGATRAVIPLVVLRLLSATTAVPAFFAHGVPAPVAGITAAFITLNVLGVVLVLRGARRPSPAGAR